MNNNYHVEYQATDLNGATYRQLITSANPIKEELKIHNMTIPVVLKYKTRFSRVIGFTADAGILIGLQHRTEYKTDASFDYEAIYYRDASGNFVYNTSATPGGPGFISYTQAQYLRNHDANYVQDYFNNTLHGITGYNVGIGIAPNHNSGTVDYTEGSIGFIVRPALSFYLSDAVALNVGAYYLYQPNDNNVSGSYQLTANRGDYNSVLNSVHSGNSQSFGGTVGLRFFFGKKHLPVVITAIDAIDPSACGLCDGAIILHGLIPDEEVNVNYSAGTANALYTGTVEPTGTVKLTGLCAGDYSNIKATIGKHSADGVPVALVNPPLRISSQNSTDPTAYGECNGTITLYGLRPNQAVNVAYNQDGGPQRFTG
jgi:hypothetical protein